MRHTLRKYLSNRGSALFMVLSTMTALMVCCMAMYFSVISSRSTQYAIFNQQQAYQSSTSLSDAIIASMNTHKGGFEGIGDEINKMKVGEVLTTNSNGFKTFSADGTGKEDDSQMGAYMMTIKRLPDEKLGDGTVVKVYDIAVTSSVNGTKEVFHNIIQMQQAAASKPLPPGPTNLFTATGYVPNDVYLDGGDIRSDAFFDNETTIINAYGQKQMDFYGNVYCGGSMVINKYIQMKSADPTIFAVRGNYTNNSNNPINFADLTGSTETELNRSRSTFMVGGDCTFGLAPITNANIYIYGNLNLISGTPLGKFENSKIFVNGKVILNKNPWNNVDYDLSNIYCNGIVDASNNGGKMGTTAGSWNDYATGKEGNGIMTVDEMVKLLDEKTTSTVHYKWIVDNTGIDLTEGKEETIKFVGAKTGIRDVFKKDEYGNTIWTNPDKVPIEHKPTYYLKYSESKRGIVLKDIVADNKDAASYAGGNLQYTLVVDTGDDPNNVFTIKVMANRDYLPDVSLDSSGNDTFSWYPKDLDNGKSTLETTGNNKPFQLLVMGKGSLVIDVPDDVIYQDDTNMKVMHYGWFALKGGKEHFFGTEEDKANKKDRIEHTEYIREPDHGPSANGEGPDGRGYDAQFFASLVHDNCGSASDKCSYEDKETKEKCSICNKPMYAMICSVHENIGSYCRECEPNKVDNYKKSEQKCSTCSSPIYVLKDSANKIIDSYCKVCEPEKAKRTCKYRVGRQEIDKFLTTHTDVEDMMTENDGKLIYPTTNIFVVSCDENADIRFTTRAPTKKDDEGPSFQGNSFFGFVYAPYMTLKVGPGTSGGDMVRLFGGFTVSDYIIDDNYAIISCYPERLPEDLMDKSSFNNPLYDLAPKSWKINLVAH